MEWDEEKVFVRCKLHELGNLSRGSRDGLVHDDIFVGLENLLCDLKVGSAGGSNDEETEGVVGQQVFKGAVGGDAGVTRRGVVGAALDDCGQLKAVDGRDERAVKDPARHAETNQTDSNHKSPPECSFETSLAFQRDYSSRRPSRARAMVTSSAYSMSLPAGTPVAMRVILAGKPRSAPASQLAVASPSSVGLVARMTSSTSPRSTRPISVPVRN